MLRKYLTRSEFKTVSVLLAIFHLAYLGQGCTASNGSEERLSDEEIFDRAGVSPALRTHARILRPRINDPALKEALQEQVGARPRRLSFNQHALVLATQAGQGEAIALEITGEQGALNGAYLILRETVSGDVEAEIVGKNTAQSLTVAGTMMVPPIFQFLIVAVILIAIFIASVPAIERFSVTKHAAKFRAPFVEAHCNLTFGADPNNPAAWGTKIVDGNLFSATPILLDVDLSVVPNTTRAMIQLNEVQYQGGLFKRLFGSGGGPPWSAWLCESLSYFANNCLVRNLAPIPAVGPKPTHIIELRVPVDADVQAMLAELQSSPRNLRTDWLTRAESRVLTAPAPDFYEWNYTLEPNLCKLAP